jgi:enediyne polyketide synthase
MWGSRLHEHRRGVDGWPVVYELSTQTTLDHANLVGNVYYANYPRWAGRCRDMYFFKVAPELYRAEDHPGELLCRRMKIDHLREAMPFDRVLTEMSIRAVYRCGVALAFQMYRVDDDGSRTKLAVAEQDVVFGTRAKGALEPRPMPERVVEALRQATRVR